MRLSLLNTRPKKYCQSADVNCGLDCSSPADMVSTVCGLIAGLSACGADDVAAKRWVRAYWGSDDRCNEGLLPRRFPGGVEQLLCCSANDRPACNAPGAAPPVVKCLRTATTFSSGPCSGQTAAYSVCAVNQSRADQDALALLTSTRRAQPSMANCSSALTSLCAIVGSKTVSKARRA